MFIPLLGLFFQGDRLVWLDISIPPYFSAWTGICSDAIEKKELAPIFADEI